MSFIPPVMQGFAIGNGLTQADIQYEAYADYALDMNLITQYDYNRLSKLFPACLTSIKFCGKAQPQHCFILSFIRRSRIVTFNYFDSP